MSFEAFMKRACIQTAVYWNAPVAAEDGSNTFATPTEISCLWKDKITMMRDNDGKDIISKASVHVLEDIDEMGMLFLGTLADLSTAQKADPRKVSNAYEIKVFVKTPGRHLNGEFARRAML
ncbi:hypothetical protein LCGC14_1958750 [marine sediment metagenome]|uniref:Uncharacterized protein n=1 Tax=marine sediment metagenome TaxID=412755 RepID=A0A0F9FF58_9ZZZZ